MYYLFYRKQSNLEKYKEELEETKIKMSEGKTPVFCEMRSAKTNLIESVPYNFINGLFLICGTLLLSKLNINQTVAVGVVLVVNSVCSAIANYIFTVVKHKLRIRLCKRLGVEPTEQYIAAMESLEYQSV